MYERPTIRPIARREDGACQTDEIAPTSVTAEFGGYFADLCRGSFVADLCHPVADLCPLKTHVFSFKDVAAAHHRVEEGHVVGKIVLHIDL
jgi:hypothetical protein